MNVKGKVTMITGGAGGLGSFMARKFTENGAVVYLLDLPVMEEKANGLIKEIEEAGGKAAFIGIDLTKEEEWKAAVEKVVAAEGKIDVLINNAGISIRKPIEEHTMEEWMKVMEINTGAVFLGTKYVLPIMEAQNGGSIINTSSVCGLIGHLYSGFSYIASKGAVTLFTKAVAARYGKYNIRCNSVHPSTVDTPMVHERLVSDPEFAAQRVGEVPLGHLCTADDVANAFLFLASEEASFINGCALTVDGGVTAY